MAKNTVASLSGEVVELRNSLNSLRGQFQGLVAHLSAEETKVNAAAKQVAPNKGDSMKPSGVRCGKCSTFNTEIKHDSIAAVKACFMG